MLIFEGDKLKGCPMEIFIAVKPFDISSKDYDYLVVKLWNCVCKLNSRADIKNSLSFFTNIQITL